MSRRQEGLVLSMGIGIGHGAWQVGTGHGRGVLGMLGRVGLKGEAGLEVNNGH